MNRSGMQRWLAVPAILAGLLLSVTGCAAGTRASSWTGLNAAGETLYAADLEQARALNAETGETIWTFPQDPEESDKGAFHAAPAVGDGRVFTTSQMRGGGIFSERENTVWALDSETGDEQWRFEGGSGRYVEGGAVSDGVFVIGNSDGNVYALDAESGTLKWTFETGHHVWATPLIASDTVYIGSMDRHLYALRLSDGGEKWSFRTKGAFASTPVLKDGVLYIGAFDDTFYAVDAETGVERWRFEGEDWFWGSPVIHGGRVYATDVRGVVYALNAENGEEIWRQKLVGDREQDVSVRAGPVLSEDGSRLFVSADNGTLYALGTTDNGSIIWSQIGEGRGLSRPIVRDSVVYQALIRGTYRVRALQVSDGRKLLWAHPPAEGQQK